MIQSQQSSVHSIQKELSKVLYRRYQTSMYFFKVKEINQILSTEPRFKSYMDFCDSRILSQDIQYLKRMYYYRTHSGKPEIDQRMKIIGQHYATNPLLSTFTYEYPMMIVTNTKSLFQRRKKRLRKIQAGQGSSDDTEEQDDYQMQFQRTEDFLDELDNSSLTERESDSEDDISFQSVSYGVYDQDEIQEEKGSLLKIDLCPEEKSLQYLIEDYQGAQIQQKNPEEISKISQKNAFVNIQNNHNQLQHHQPKTVRESAIDILPIQDRIKLQRDEKQKKVGSLSSYVDILLSKPISFSGLGLNYQNPIASKYSTIVPSSQPQSIDKQRQQRAARRKKIRQKAEQLLKKVKNSEGVQVTQP